MRIIFITVIIVTPVVGATVAFSGNVAADATEGDTELESGGTYWEGQRLGIDLSNGPNGADLGGETIEIREFDTDDNEFGALVAQISIPSNGQVEIATDDLDGTYIVEYDNKGLQFDDTGDWTQNRSASDADGTATFEVVNQSITVKFQDDTVTNRQASSNGTNFDIDSNRGSYSANISAGGDLSNKELFKIFTSTELDDSFDRADYEDVSNGNTNEFDTRTNGNWEVGVYANSNADEKIFLYQLSDVNETINFDGISRGKYVFNVDVIDTEASDSDDIYVENESKPPKIEYEFDIDNDGDAYTIGFPAPLNGTLADALNTDNQNIGPETTAYVFEDGTWVSKDIDNIQPEALDAVVIVTDGDDGNEVINLSMELETTQILTPGEVTVTEGWNYVSAPAFENADTVFEVGNAREVFNPFKRVTPTRSYISPANQFLNYRFTSGNSENVSPFHGYFIYVEDDSAIQTGLAGGAVDQKQADEYLNID